MLLPLLVDWQDPSMPVKMVNCCFYRIPPTQGFEPGIVVIGLVWLTVIDIFSQANVRTRTSGKVSNPGRVAKVKVFILDCEGSRTVIGNIT